MNKYTPEQQAENRRIWVEALRSGKYKQATRKLRDDTSFCCLGVACDIFDPKGWMREKVPAAEGDYGMWLFRLERARTLLPRDVREMFGLRDSVGGHAIILEDGEVSDDALTLADMNDQGLTFEEIADVIEEAPHGLLAETREEPWPA